MSARDAENARRRIHRAEKNLRPSVYVAKRRLEDTRTARFTLCPHRQLLALPSRFQEQSRPGESLLIDATILKEAYSSGSLDNLGFIRTLFNQSDPR